MAGYIIQVIGKFQYEDLILGVDSDEVKAKLASEAIKKSIAKTADIILLVPESLVTLMADDVDMAAEYIGNPRLLERVTREEILREPLIKEGFEVRLVESTGVYFGKNQKYRVEFENTLDNIIIHLFLYLISLRDSDIFIDVSTGQNFYVVALLEAVRHLIVYRKLENIFNRMYSRRVKISTMTPYTRVGGGEARQDKLPLRISEMDVKVFFEYPMKATFYRGGRASVSVGDYVSRELNEAERKEIIGELVKKFGKDFEDVVKKLLNLCMRAYNALRYNTPLCFYGRQIIDLSECDAEKALKALRELVMEIESRKKITIEGNCLKVSRIPMSRGAVINTALTAALFKSIKENLGHLNEREAVALTEFEGTFKEIYESLGLQLNLTFLQREISNIRRLSASLGEDEEKVYGKMLEEPPKGAQDPRRNFFAHSGLTYDAVYVKKEGGEIKIRYIPEKSEEIKSYLSEPL